MTNYARRKFLALSSGEEKAKVDELDKPKIVRDKSSVELGAKFHKAMCSINPEPFSIMDYAPSGISYAVPSMLHADNLRQSLNTIEGRLLSSRSKACILGVLFEDMSICTSIILDGLSIEVCSDPMDVMEDYGRISYTVSGPLTLKVSASIAETEPNYHVFVDNTYKERFCEKLLSDKHTKIIATNSGKKMFIVMIDSIVNAGKGYCWPQVINITGVIVKDISNLVKGVS